jgi:WD40 repeat protein
MPRDLNPEDDGSISEFDGARLRVSSGRTRISLVSKKVWLVATVLAGIPALIWSDPRRPQSSSTGPLTLVGHDRTILAVQFSPDGRRLASCGFDATVRIWDATHWEQGRSAEVATLPHPTEVLAIAFSPDGSLLATASIGSVAIWSRDSSYVRVVERTGATFRSLAFSPDGRTLALGGEDGSIRLWEMPAARERAVLRDSDASVHCVAFSPDGKLLVSGNDDGRVLLWRAPGGARLGVLHEGSHRPIRAVVFSPDGRTLGVADPAGAGDALLYDMETATIRIRLPGGFMGIVSLAFSPDGRVVATAATDRLIKLWDPAEGKELATIRDGRALRSLAFSPDGRWLAHAGGDEVVRLMDMRRPAAERSG